MSPTDDEIRAMLAGRADRARIRPADVETVVAGARQVAAESPRRTGPLGRFGRLRPFLAGSASGAAIVLVAVVVALPLANRPATTPTPGPSATPGATSGASSPSPIDPPAPATIVTASMLQPILADRPQDLVGRTLAVEGRLHARTCDGPEDCQTATRLDGAELAVVPAGDIGPGPWDGSGVTIDGLFALMFIAERSADGLPIAQFLGTILPGPGGFTWSVGDLVAGQAREGATFAAVRGWIVRSPVHACPSSEPPNGLIGGPRFGCPTDDWLTAEAFQPLAIDGSVTGPEGGLAVPSGSYQRFALDPLATGGGGVAPREATFLTRWTAWCAELADCFIGPEHYHWIVEARLDPLPPEPPAPTTPPEPSAGRHPGGIPTAIGGEPVLVGLELQRRLAEATDATSFLAGGWFDSADLSTCSGGIGPSDPNPLGARGCPRYRIVGIPGRLYVPPERIMPDGDRPIVVRVHNHDPAAETCWPETVAACRARVVVDEVAWFGDEATAATPIGPTRAVAWLISAPIADVRHVDGADNYVDEDLFALPIACGAPFPASAFDVRGDPRLALLLVFADPAAREAFEATNEPARAHDLCRRPTTIPRPADAAWVGHENLLVLTFGDDAFDEGIAAVLATILPGDGTMRRIPLPDPALDRSVEILTNHLEARAAGPSAIGYELDFNVDPGPLNPDGDPTSDVEAGYLLDVLRRDAAGALSGRFQLVATDPTDGPAGEALELAQDEAPARGWHYRVTFPGATDPALAEEEFLVVHLPTATYRDWRVIRLAGAPYPVVPLPSSTTPSEAPGAEPSSGDVPCRPVGEPCGP